MKKKKISPLLIICFNRPSKVKNLIKIISQNDKNINTVYFKIDGPKNIQDKIDFTRRPENLTISEFASMV